MFMMNASRCLVTLSLVCQAWEHRKGMQKQLVFHNKPRVMPSAAIAPYKQPTPHTIIQIATHGPRVAAPPW